MKFKPATTPDGCVDLHEHERRLTQLAASLEERAQALLGVEGCRISAASGGQLALASVRARALATELARHRDEDERERRLLQHDRELAGIVDSRPRLKFTGSRRD
jgi:hypothetical protein